MRAGQATARAIDPLSDVVAFIDDTYFIGLPEAAVAGHKAYQQHQWEDIKVQETKKLGSAFQAQGVMC